jgi:hypothetical protein
MLVSYHNTIQYQNPEDYNFTQNVFKKKRLLERGWATEKEGNIQKDTSLVFSKRLFSNKRCTSFSFPPSYNLKHTVASEGNVTILQSDMSYATKHESLVMCNKVME